jgi:hypothetical protein
MSNISPNKKYILIPRNEEKDMLNSRLVFGRDLLEAIKDEAELSIALERGDRTITFKGNEYYLDEAIEE